MSSFQASKTVDRTVLRNVCIFFQDHTFLHRSFFSFVFRKFCSRRGKGPLATAAGSDGYDRLRLRPGGPSPWRPRKLKKELGLGLGLDLGLGLGLGLDLSLGLGIRKKNLVGVQTWLGKCRL